MNCPSIDKQQEYPSCGCAEGEEQGESSTCNSETKKSSPLSPSQRRLELTMLPDEILVDIGKSVATLCGVHGFVLFSRTSKRLRRLLMHRETIAAVIGEGNSRIQRNRSFMLLPSCSSEQIVASTLEQLAFYESIKEQNLLEENRFTPQLGSKIRTILNQHPSSILLLDAHSGRGELMATTPYGHFDYRAKHAYEKIVVATGTNDISSEDRIRIRVWGRAVAEKASESLHPYSGKARKGKGWVEIFFRIPGQASNMLELPPRPDFYRELEVPQEQQYQNFVDFDSSDED